MYTVNLLMYLIFLICTSLPFIYDIMILHSIHTHYMTIIWCIAIYCLLYATVYCLSKQVLVINHNSSDSRMIHLLIYT